MRTRSRILLFLFFLSLIIALLSLDKSPSNLSMPKKYFVVDQFLVQAYLPLQKLWKGFTFGIKNGFRHYVALVHVKQENLQLKKNIESKNLYILALEELVKSKEEQSAAQKSLIDLQLQGIQATVVGYDPFSQSYTLWLSKGVKDGVNIDQPVVTSRGLVGRIINVFAHSSQVLLLVDPHFSVDVVNKETRLRALVVGSGGGSAHLERHPWLSHIEFLQLGDSINEGDLLITSGQGGIYPAGIPVGNIINVRKGEDAFIQTSDVLPAVDLSELEQVMIVSTKHIQ